MHPLPILNQPEGITPKLKVVPLLVDAERAVSLDVDPPADICDDVVQALSAGLQPDVRDPHHRDAAPPIRTVRAMRPRLPDLRRHLSTRAVIHKDPLANDVPALAGHAIIIIPRGGQGLRFGVVRDHGHVR